MTGPGRPPPPSEWAGAHDAGHDVYWVADPALGAAGSAAGILVWHWCPPAGRWRAANVRKHTLVVADPLHLEPSLLWDCCGTHGYIRGGLWTPA